MIQQQQCWNNQVQKEFAHLPKSEEFSFEEDALTQRKVRSQVTAY
jgi:hypothetical protein